MALDQIQKTAKLILSSSRLIPPSGAISQSQVSS
jgi:hypothetical protein